MINVKGMQHRWREETKSLYKGIGATKCAEEIYSIGNEFTPQQIVDKASDPNTELHKCMEWDDRKAANEFRKQQARNVLRNLVVVNSDENIQKEVSYPIAYHPVDTTNYHTTTYILGKESYREKLLKTAISELKSFERKYAMLDELCELFSVIDAAIDNLS